MLTTLILKQVILSRKMTTRKEQKLSTCQSGGQCLNYAGDIIKKVMHNESGGDMEVAKHCITELKKVSVELHPTLNISNH